MHQKLLFLMHFRFLYLNLSILKIQRNSLLLIFFFSSALSGFLTISVTTVAHRTFETLGIVHKSRHARWGRGSRPGCNLGGGQSVTSHIFNKNKENRIYT